VDFGRIFSSNKSASQYRKKGFYSNSDPNKQEFGGFFVFSNSSSKLRKQKQIALDVLFGLSSLRLIQSGPTVPLISQNGNIFYQQQQQQRG
jgi:hypothetical protein